MTANGYGSRRAVTSWCMYDWANSAFTTLVVTFIYNSYFALTFVSDPDAGVALWARGVSISAIIIALLSPIAGAVADKSGRRRSYLIIATVVCAVFTVALGFVSPTHDHAVFKALTLFIVANVAFEMGGVFYNSFLPELVSQDRIGRISGYGWGLGYLGGLVAMIMALVGFVQPETPWFGISTADGFNVRATNFLVAGWFLLFSIPMFLFVPEKAKKTAKVDVRGAFRDLGHTLREIRHYRDTVKFLIARLVYNDGLVTVFSFGAIYAGGVFGMDQAERLVFGIVLNLVAGLGAFGFGFLDDRIGGRKTILVTLVGLCVATVLAVWAPNRTWFWIAGIMVGIFVGPNQSASRSLMGRFVPEKHKGEFFGFFAFSGKVTSFAGPALLGLVTAFAGMRVGFSTLLLFFIVGALILMTVDEKAGIEAARVADA